MPTSSDVNTLDLTLTRDDFMRTLIRELAGTLQEVVGLDEAAGFVSVVGLQIGKQINQLYCDSLGQDAMSEEQVANVLVDLKRRIQGDFYIIEHSDEKIVLGNRACPFGDKVVGRPALCMMTSNVFGSIAADNLGFAKVHIDESIAMGSQGCRIIVHLKTTPESEASDGRVYFKTFDDASDE